MNLQELSLNQCIPQGGTVRNLQQRRGRDWNRPSVQRLVWKLTRDAANRDQQPRERGPVFGDARAMEVHYETYTWNSGPHGRLDGRNGCTCNRAGLGLCRLRRTLGRRDRSKGRRRGCRNRRTCVRSLCSGLWLRVPPWLRLFRGALQLRNCGKLQPLLCPRLPTKLWHGRVELRL